MAKKWFIGLIAFLLVGCATPRPIGHVNVDDLDGSKAAKRHAEIEAKIEKLKELRDLNQITDINYRGGIQILEQSDKQGE